MKSFSMQGSRVLAVVAGMIAAAGMATPARATDPAPPFRQVFTVIFENIDYKDALAQPYFKHLTQTGASLTNMIAEKHPSQGNYIAMVAGSDYGVATDSSVNLDVAHLGDLLEAQGKNWKIYLEGWPGNCFKGASSGMYERKHNPFISFKNIQNNLARCNAHLVNSNQLATDVAGGQVPDYALYIPNDNNNGHDTGVSYADKWLKGFATPLLANADFMKDRLFIATFDESAGGATNWIYTSLNGPGVKAGATSSTQYSHVSLLRTVEDALGLSTLPNQTSTPAISGVWD